MRWPGAPLVCCELDDGIVLQLVGDGCEVDMRTVSCREVDVQVEHFCQREGIGDHRGVFRRIAEVR